MKNFTLVIFSLMSIMTFSQSVESITEKVTDKICECIKDNISKYDEIKPEFNRCYDKEFNQIFDLVNSEEQKILLQQGVLDDINNRIVPTLNDSCEKLRKIIQSELNNSVESAAQNNSDPCPTNFSGNDLNKIKKMDGEIIAFDGLITEVHFAHKDKPYYQVKLEGGNTIWIASLVNSGYEKQGNVIRILGYVSNTGDDEYAKKYNETDYHILAFGVVDLVSKQIAMLPGSDLQIKQWINGCIPKSKE